MPLPSFVLSLLLIACVTAGCGAAAAGSGASSAGSVTQQTQAGGALATDFTLRDTEGRQVRLSDFLGKKVIVLNFWATWCLPCQAELPLLQQIYAKHKDRGLVILAISMDGPETVAQVPAQTQRYALTFPVLLDEDTKVVAVYNPKRTAPLTVEIDRKGQIARVRSGYSAGDEKLIADDVASLLGN